MLHLIENHHPQALGLILSHDQNHVHLRSPHPLGASGELRKIYYGQCGEVKKFKVEIFADEQERFNILIKK